MIVLNRNYFFTFIAIFNASMFFSIQYADKNYFLSLIIFLFLTFIPGFIILLTFRIKKLYIAEYIFLSLGLSLFFLMFLGVIFNYSLILFNYSPLLNKKLLVIYYGLFTFLFIVIAYLRNKDLKWIIYLQSFTFNKLIYFLIPPLITIFSILSAILLNNSNNNSVAIFTVLSIACLILISLVFHKRISKNFYPWAIYFISLSLLLLISMRSWFVSGWDIQHEFALFQLTKKINLWSPANFKDAYNACLSITLLPTIISKLTSFPDDFIFKIFYQILFAFTPVIIYQTYIKYAKPIIAYIAVIYIISQPLFIQPMTSLMRQEIAFIFFSLMIFVLFNKQFSELLRNILFLIFGLGMVLSHYSTTYITIILLFVTYSIIFLFRISEKINFISHFYKKIKITNPASKYNYYLNPLSLILLLCFTLFWYGYINNQLGQVQKVAFEGIIKMQDLFKSDIKSGEAQKAISFLKKDYTSIKDLRNYSNSQLLKNKVYNDRLYPPKTYISSNVYPLFPAVVNPVINTPLNKYIFIFFEIIKEIFKFFVMTGPLFLLIVFYKKNQIPREYIILCIIAIFLVIILTIHPTLGLQYNLSRLYLQILYYLSLPSFLFFLFIFSFFRRIKKYIILITGLMISILYIYLTGITNQVFGGEAKIYLNNFGADYDKFYIHEDELASATWLKDYIGYQPLLYADREANLRIYRIMDRGYNQNLLPALIYKDAYVYGSYANIVNNRTSVYFEGSTLEFSFPKKFLENNKNIIYSNKNSIIYK